MAKLSYLQAIEKGYHDLAELMAIMISGKNPDGTAWIMDASTTGATDGGTSTAVADVTVSSTAATVIPANASRKGFTFQNTGGPTAGTVRIAFGEDPTPTKGIQVPPGGVLIFSMPFVPMGNVRAIRESTVDTTCGGEQTL